LVWGGGKSRAPWERGVLEGKKSSVWEGRGGASGRGILWEEGRKKFNYVARSKRGGSGKRKIAVRKSNVQSM